MPKVMQYFKTVVTKWLSHVSADLHTYKQNNQLWQQEIPMSI